MPAKPVLLTAAVCVIGALLLSSLISGNPPQAPTDWLSPIGPGVTAAGLLLLAFDRWIWRWRYVDRCHPRPVLHGTWRGSLASKWVNPQTGEGVPVDPEVYAVIRQRFWSISIRLLTNESSSRSTAAQFERAPDGECQLVYVYTNVPRVSVRDRSAIHYGGVILNVPRDRSGRLEGHYFTDRQTTGELVFDKHAPEAAQSYQDARNIKF